MKSSRLKSALEIAAVLFYMLNFMGLYVVLLVVFG